MTYDNWRLATPPEYDEPAGDEPAESFAELLDAFRRFNPYHVARRLECLAHNLAIGAALCEAFNLGLCHLECGNVHPSVNWSPGCRWSAP